jgi:hypothetical protein
MNYYFIAYILLSIIICLSVCANLFQTQRTIAGLIFFVLSIFIFIFFGVRWFSTGNVAGAYTGSWPPIINTCPDYLVYFKKGSVDTCIDLLGVNRSGGALVPWSGDDSSTNPPAATNKYFPFVYKTGMTSDQLRVLCDSAQQKGLTWEGITNGESCTFLPPSQVLGPNASGPSAGCPS